MKKAIPILALLLLIGCNKNAPIRPNAIDAIDSKTYDTLLVAQSVLDNAKVAFNQGKLPESSKATINQMGAAYNLLRDCWIQYRSNPNATNAQAIAAASIQVNRFIADLRGLGVKP